MNLEYVNREFYSAHSNRVFVRELGKCLPSTIKYIQPSWTEYVFCEGLLVIKKLSLKSVCEMRVFVSNLDGIISLIQKQINILNLIFKLQNQYLIFKFNI